MTYLARDSDLLSSGLGQRDDGIRLAQLMRTLHGREQGGRREHRIKNTPGMKTEKKKTLSREQWENEW
jgi:hypothetical protein